jgi:hypothetical protein
LHFQESTRANGVVENEEYFLAMARHAALSVPPFESTFESNFDREAVQVIKAFLETRREKPF